MSWAWHVVMGRDMTLHSVLGLEAQRMPRDTCVALHPSAAAHQAERRGGTQPVCATRQLGRCGSIDA